MDPIEEFVSRYHKLSASSLKEFQKLFSPKDFKKNDVIYRTGEAPSKFFIMLEGVARSVVIDKNGKEKTRTLFKGPAIFTSLVISSLYGEPSVAEFNCLTNATIYEGKLFTIYKTHARET